MPVSDAIKLYKVLLRHPHDSWRAYNQHVYAILRDYIATEIGVPSEYVQNIYEAEARKQDA